MRTVARGHPLFGPACDLIRAEALIRIECEPPLPVGLLALGQRSEQNLDARHGSELLMFLGRSLAAIIRRWLMDPRDLNDHPARALVARWAGHLLHDRRRSRAYGPRLCRDRASADRFPRALSRRGDRGRRPADRHCPSDLRAFLADRRRNGLGASSAARELSAVRAFLTYAAEAQGQMPQLPRTRLRGARAPCRARPRRTKRLRSPRMRRGCSGRLDRRARPRHPAAAVRRRPARCGGHVADGRSAADRRDAAGHRQAVEDADRADHAGGARSDRGLCPTMPVADRA